MVCIYCGAPTAVKNSRRQHQSNHIWRRRACSACSSVFTTIERPELATTFMVSGSRADAELEPFNRDRLFVAIYESCKHRPNALNEAASLTQTIISNLIADHSGGFISRGAITKRAHAVLQHFDAAAATFYAAYHKPEM